MEIFEASMRIPQIRRNTQLTIFSLGLLICGIAFSARGYSASPPNTESQNKIFQKSSKQSFVTDALKQGGPSVVTIETKRRVSSSNRYFLVPRGLLIDPSLEEFFGMPFRQSPQTMIERGQGSGVIFSSKGLVLTNAHVIDKSDGLIVGISDGRRFTGEVIGQDSLTDLAVIRLNGPGPWPQAKIGDSDSIEVGDWAIAVGNPYGLEKTVTLGIISNLNRNVAQLGISDKRLRLIQTDAAINPGNSGGPLLNSKGEVIGINTLIQSGPGAGLGFAIPINKAIYIANQLAKTGKAIHPMIGINLTHLNSNSETVEYTHSIGAQIISIVPGGPAEKQGLKINDIILKVNNVTIKNPQEIIDIISDNGVNRSISFTILRKNKEMIINIKPIDFRNFKLLK